MDNRNTGVIEEEHFYMTDPARIETGLREGDRVRFSYGYGFQVIGFFSDFGRTSFRKRPYLEVSRGKAVDFRGHQLFIDKDRFFLDRISSNDIVREIIIVRDK